MTGLAQDRRELVHNPAGDAGIVVLRFLAQQGFADGIEPLIRNRFQQRGGGDLEAALLDSPPPSGTVEWISTSRAGVGKPCSRQPAMTPYT